MEKKFATKLTGLAIATAAAGLFTAASVTQALAAAHHSTKVHCEGVNACKGKGSCKTADNACKGQNSCKGKGFVGLTKDQCDQVGGTVAAAAKAK